MIVFTDDSHRDLKVKEAAASMARPAEAGKKRKASAAEARPAAAGKKRKEAVALAPEPSDDGVPKKEKECDSLFEAGEMLKLREEYWEMLKLWGEEKFVPGALDRWAERKLTQDQPRVVNKKKVVRILTPDGYIDYIIENPAVMTELSDEEMAECPERYRQSYAIAKIINAKSHKYEQALIAQYRAFGFAYDEIEKEVTDDDNEKEVTDEEERVGAELGSEASRGVVVQ